MTCRYNVKLAFFQTKHVRKQKMYAVMAQKLNRHADIKKIENFQL